MRLEVRKDYPRRFRFSPPYEKAEVEVPFINRGIFYRRVKLRFDLRGLDGNVAIIKRVSFWRGVTDDDVMIVRTSHPIQAQEIIQAISDTLSEMAAEREAAILCSQGLPVVLVGIQSAGGEPFGYWKALQADLPALSFEELGNLLNRRIYEASLPGQLLSVDTAMTRKVELVPLITIRTRHPWRADALFELVEDFLASPAKPTVA